MPSFGRKRGKDAAMLGVFGDDSDSEEAEGFGKKRGGGKGGGGGRGGGRGESKPLSTRPVGFVSSGSKSMKTSGPSMAPPPPPAARSGLGLGAGEAEPPAEKTDREFASFEANTKGFGSRMLQKMGWTKGMAIGKSSSGIVNPLEQKLRPNSMGLGYGGFKETTTKAKLQQERILHADSDRPYADSDSDEELNAARKKARGAAAAAAQPQ